jgi:soluble lytic murein transglycosylase-like protein
MEGGRVEVPAADVVSIEPEEVFLPVPQAPPEGPFSREIHSAAQKHGLDEALISSVIAAESNFNPRAVSRERALGLMQLLPKTAARLSVSNAFDPAQNVDAGTRYLRQLLDQYHGNLMLALAAYNAGPERVEQYGGVPPYYETHDYLRRVARKFAERKKADAAKPTIPCVVLAFPCDGSTASPFAH